MSIKELLDKFLQVALPLPEMHSIDPRKNKIIRDTVWGMIELKPHEVLFVNTPLFQRLRGISQTGFTYMVYPCAVHSRFEHSLGCLHLTGRVLKSLEGHRQTLSLSEQCTVRLAALLHDISHCIFSHVSEDIYENDQLLVDARNEVRQLFQAVDPDNEPYVGGAEVIAYLILTSAQFAAFLTQARAVVTEAQLPRDVTGENIARLIVGLPLKENINRVFITQIINGPFDVDKLDYQTRDGYFTGVALPVDVNRLLASLCIVKSKTSDRLMLAIDYRGIAAIEQLLFNRMLLFDSVYHHHKNRAAVQLFQSNVATKKDLTLEWLLNHDEYDFYGLRGLPAEFETLVRRMRNRDLPHRAVVLHPSTMAESGRSVLLERTTFTNPKVADPWSDVRAKMVSNLPAGTEFYLDFPKPPRFDRIERATLIAFDENHHEPLMNVFKFSTAMNSYAQQCKYRGYVFSRRDQREIVAGAAYKAFKSVGIQLKQAAFRLAHINPTEVERHAGETILE